MGNWLTTRDAVKRAARQYGATAIPDARNHVVDNEIASVSAELARASVRDYFPKIATKLYRWPTWNREYTWTLWLDTDLVSASAIAVRAGDTVPIALTHFFLEPQKSGPPYNRIEVDLSSSDSFQSGNTPQRSVSVTGRWGYPTTSRAAGIVASGLAASASATTFACSDSSLIDVGDTIKIDDEELFVTERGSLDSSATLSGNPDALESTVTLGISDGTKVRPGEIALVDAERMFARDVTGNNLTVNRAWDATPIAAHTLGAKVYVYRTLTVERGANGTTPAVHIDTSPITIVVPDPIASGMALARVLSNIAQTDTSWARTIGTENAKEIWGTGIEKKYAAFLQMRRRARIGVI